MAKLYRGKAKVAIELTEGEIETLLEAAQTLQEVLQKEQEVDGGELSSDDLFMLRVLDQATRKLERME